MWNRSRTHVKEFILVGFPGSQYLQLTMFLFLLFAYVLTIMSNVSIIILVRTHRHLHSPMYYFLCNFAFLEICFTTACVPKTLVNLGSQSQSISFTGCLLQMYFVFSFGCTEYFLLAVMAYDRYLAICYPLSYSTIMNSTLSTWLAVVSWIGGFLTISVPISLISRLSFCGSNVINHFFCDISPWIILSCSDTSLVEMVCFITFTIVILGSCVITLVSYTYIIHTVLKIPSAQGRRRAFSTCSSHLMVIIIWYGSTIFLHVKPSVKASLELTKIITILNTVITPLLNPFIYAFRNTAVKEILKKTFSWKTESRAQRFCPGLFLEASQKRAAASGTFQVSRKDFF